MGKVEDDNSSSNAGINNEKRDNNNDSDYGKSNRLLKSDEPLNRHYEESSQSCPRGQRTFSDRVEKGNIREEDAQSNTSSTDDLVRELLDPNDRPRNVWHVVEGPKESPDNESSETTHRKNSESNHGARSPQIPAKLLNNTAHSSENYQHSNPSRDRSNPESQARQTSTHQSGAGDGSNDEIIRKRRHDKLSPARRSSSKNREDDRDSRQGRDRGNSVRDRRRSSSNRTRSRRRHDYSDEDEYHDDDDDYDKRRHGRRSGHSRRHNSRSRSRSRSPVSSSRRRDRSRSDSSQRNSRTVVVLQLGQRITSRDLEDYFGDNVGNMREVRLIMDSRTRRHKGVAYVEFNDSKSASKALALNGRNLEGSPLIIQTINSNRGSSDHYHSTVTTSSSSHHHSSSSSRPNHYHTSSGPTTHPSSRSLPPNAYRVYIGALHTGITDEMLRTIVEPFGPVLRVEVIKDRTTGVSRGYAFVTYASIEDGQEAVKNLDGFELAGKNMRVSKSTEKSEH